MIINLKGTETQVSATGNGNNFSLSTCIKVTITATETRNFTLRSTDENGDVLIGDTSLTGPGTYFIEKRPTDLIVVDVNTNVYGTPVGFTIA